jgi:hypothetical protein
LKHLLKKQPAISLDDSLFAVAERRADRMRVLLVKRGARPAAIATREFALADSSGVLSWLGTKNCGDFRMILPASAVVVRMSTLPAASPTQMLTALSLQAESFFLGTVPHHRLGLAVLPDSGGTEREGIVVAWPPAQPAPELSPQLEAITRYLPEPAALLPLASADIPAVTGDRRSGSIAIALRSPRGVVLRSAREDGSADSWNEGLRRAIAETALNAGIEPSKIAAVVAAAESNVEQTGDRAVIIDPAIRQQLEGKIAIEVGAEALEASWWRDWAVLLGAGIVASGQFAELCQLRRHQGGAEPTRFSRLLVRYSDPSRALRVCVAAVAIMAVVPLAAAWLRSSIYQWKMPTSLGEFQLEQRDIERRIAHYEAVARKSLPVSKLLGDLAVATPDGIELESIQLSLTQGVSVRGTAKSQGSKQPDEIVNAMARQMESSGVFRKTNWGWNAPDGRGEFKFNLTAEIVRPTLRPNYDESRDWAIKTLAQRKYPDADAGSTKPELPIDGDSGAEGDRGTNPDGGDAGRSTASATNTLGPVSGTGTGVMPDRPAVINAPGGEPVARGETAGAGDGDVATNSEGPALPDRGIGRRPTPGPDEQPKPAASGGAGTGAGAGPGATGQANLAVPDTITDEQLKGMSKPELRAKLSEFAVAARRQDLDAETRARLSADFNRILNALKGSS